MHTVHVNNNYRFVVLVCLNFFCYFLSLFLMFQTYSRTRSERFDYSAVIRPIRCPPISCQYRDIGAKLHSGELAVTRRSFPTSRNHTHESLPLTVLTTLFFPSQQTPSTSSTGRFPRGLNSTAVL